MFPFASYKQCLSYIRELFIELIHPAGDTSSCTLPLPASLA